MGAGQRASPTGRGMSQPCGRPAPAPGAGAAPSARGLSGGGASVPLFLCRSLVRSATLDESRWLSLFLCGMWTVSTSRVCWQNFQVVDGRPAQHRGVCARHLPAGQQGPRSTCPAPALRTARCVFIPHQLEGRPWPGGASGDLLPPLPGGSRSPPLPAGGEDPAAGSRRLKPNPRRRRCGPPPLPVASLRASLASHVLIGYIVRFTYVLKRLNLRKISTD